VTHPTSTEPTGARVGEEVAEAFARDRYAVVRGFLEPQTVEVFLRYVQDRVAGGDFGFEDNAITRRWYRYKDPLSQAILTACQPRLESVTGLTLLPTYSYTAVYPPGAELQAHRDRPACEVSLSLTIANQSEDGSPATPWPFGIRHGGSERTVCLQPGDAVLYRGCEVKHFRRPLGDGRYNASVFLHYVERDGPHAAHAGDGVDEPRMRAMAELAAEAATASRHQ
jgi:hypothetical protein